MRSLPPSGRTVSLIRAALGPAVLATTVVLSLAPAAFTAPAPTSTLPDALLRSNARLGPAVLLSPKSVPTDGTSPNPHSAPKRATTPAGMVTSGSTLTLSGAAAQFGSAVAVAGDVNGDGYSDLIVGAPNYSNGQSNEGEVLLFLGGPSGYSSTPAWTFESNAAGANLGWSVAPAGDVNGDGYDDVIVGAPNLSSNPLTNNGRAYVFLGGPAGLAATPAWSYDGTQAGELLGWSVCTAGDVNADGYDDVLVGSPGYFDITAPQDRARVAGGRSALASPARIAVVFNNGRAQAFYGSGSGPSLSPSWAKSGIQYGGAFGYCVSTAHDIDADGYDDVVIGAPYGDNLYTAVSQAGEFDVFSGSASGLASAASPVGYGAGTGELRGFSVAGVGDINGDGYADVVVGAPGYTHTATNQGAIFGFRGSAYGLYLDFDFLDEGSVLSPSYAGGEFGYSVAPAGDVNGDGYADFVAGAPFYVANGVLGINAGYVAVYEGTAQTSASLNQNYARQVLWMTGGNQNDFGYSVCSAGDEDGDGFGDVVAGAPTFNSNQGHVVLFRGAGDMPGQTPEWSSDVNAGPSGVGDLNGDGYDDLVAVNIGAAGDSLTVFLGGPGRLPTTPSQSFLISAITSGSNPAIAALCTGDVNGDGYDDVFLLVQHGGDPSLGDGYIVPGSASGLAASHIWRSPEAIPVIVGLGVAAGDVNGDGIGDLLLPTANLDSLYLFLGAHGQPTSAPAWAIAITDSSGTVPYTRPVGDSNGDGFGDVIVVEPNYSGSFTQQGRVRLYLGGSTGLASTPARTYLGTSASYRLGYALGATGAGDLNGDGLGDIVLSGFDANTGIVVYGNDALTPTAIPAEGLSGYHACFPAGDVDGDGYSDVMTACVDPTSSELKILWRGSSTGLVPTPAWESSFSHYIPKFDIAWGDFNGDGFTDPMFCSDGPWLVWYGNDGVTGAPGAARAARQREGTDLAPISLLGLSDSPTLFRLAARGCSPAGRARVRMETDVKNWGASFETNLGNLVHDAWTPTGAPGSYGSFVALDALRALPASGPTDKWRMRIATLSPYFPGGPWLSPSGNGRAQYDVRNASSTTGVPIASAMSAHLEFAAPSPNPSRDETHLSFTLPQRATLDLAIYDLQGRRIATLASGEAAAGPHEAQWGGRSDSGQLLGAGIYFARLVTGGKRLTQKVVRVR